MFGKKIIDAENVLATNVEPVLRQIVAENLTARPTTDYLLALLLVEVRGLRADLANRDAR
jgi:hypothetical protein